MTLLHLKTISSQLLAAAVVGASQNATLAAEPFTVFAFKDSVVMQAEAAGITPGRAKIVEQDSFSGKKGVSLKADLATNVGSPDTQPDLVFRVRASESGRYVIRTHAATDAKGSETMRRAKGKHDSLRLMISVSDSRPTKRVVFVPWRPSHSCKQTTGKFNLNGQEQEIRVWLPEGLRLDYLQISPYTPPKVSAAVTAYQPTVIPPASRPRIWVNTQSLPKVRANITKGENAPLWSQVRELAAKPFEFKVDPDTEVSYNAGLEKATVAKAFVHLMTGEKALGQEAVALTRDYLGAVEFGNLLDITREIGRAIYAAAQVYDWCYELMSPEDRESIRHDLMRLADDMEIGWPPFKQMIVNGHGNEGQVNRDLLCLAIAIYDEDPLPYRYCSYRILEELVPMRRFEYQSPRHNQGVSYGPYRFGWDMHAAWLFYRMTGKRVFDDNIAEVCKFWLYMRAPGGVMLQDGDGGGRVNLGATALLCYAYANDPVIKGDFQRQGGLRHDPILVLLLNDPDLQAAENSDSLPLTRDFGPVLSSMVARTGWNMGRNLSEVVVEMKGGGYNFGNHQHSDAGSFQIYYRGLQAVDLGQYHFYGTPYDSNFCKRSISHSMMLAVDPDEKFHRNSSNDGGARFVRSCPRTPEQVRTNPLFANGNLVSSDFGPSRQRPFYSYFSVDLTSAYSKKIKTYIRTFCFLNLDNAQTPGVLIVLDNMTTAKPEFRKYWQVNTLNPPETTVDGVILKNSALGLTGKVNVRMLRPSPEERNLQILSGVDANSVFGKYFTAPNPNGPKAKGHRIMFSPVKEQANDVFLTVMSMSDEEAPELLVDVMELPEAFVLTLADRVVVLSKTGKLLKQPLQVNVRNEGNCQLLLAGLAPGDWSVRGQDGKVQLNTRVDAARNTAFFLLPGGQYTIQPKAIPGAPAFQAPADFVPAPGTAFTNRIFLDGKMVAVPPTKATETCQLLPAIELLDVLGLAAVKNADTLQVKVGNRTAVFKTDANTFELNGHTFRMPVPAVYEHGTWFVPDSVLAPLLDRSLVRGGQDNCVELTPNRIPNRDDILWIEAAGVSDPRELYAMLADIPGRKAYWAVQGDGVLFDLVLTRPVRAAGVGIKWHQGARRKATFALETSTDGITWQKVFEGSSSGTTAEMERYSFPPHEIRQIRFHGFGNTTNDWNSIVHFRLLRAE